MTGFHFDDEDDDVDLGRLLTAAAAHRELGLNQGTVRSWASRKSSGLEQSGLSAAGRPMYWEADLLAAAAGIAIYDERGRRRVRAIPRFDDRALLDR